MECGNKIIDETADLGDNNNNSSIGKSSYTPEQESAVNRYLLVIYHFSLLIYLLQNILISQGLFT